MAFWNFMLTLSILLLTVLQVISLDENSDMTVDSAGVTATSSAAEENSVKLGGFGFGKIKINKKLRERLMSVGIIKMI